MTPIDPVRFGQHDAMLVAMNDRLESVEAYVLAMNTKLTDIQIALATKRGEEKIPRWLGGTIGGAIISTLIIWIGSKLHG